MTVRNVLLVTLWIAFIIECAFPILGFGAPAFMLSKFNVAVSADTLFVGHVAAWLLLFVTIACGIALKWVHARNPAGLTLSIALGVWWMGIGLALALKYGHLENLALDTFKGAILVVAAVFVQRSEGATKGDSVA